MKLIGTRNDSGAAIRLAATILGIVAALVLTGYTVSALPGPTRAAADFSIAATPNSPDSTIHRGQALSFRIRVGWSRGSSGPVTLTVSGIPSGAEATFLSPDGRRATVTQARPSASLVVTTTQETPLGRYVLTIAGRSGDETRRATVPLRIRRHRRTSSGLSAAPRSTTIAAGTSGSFSVCLTRRRAGRPVTLSIGSALPVGTVASFRPNPIRRGCSTLTLTTATTSSQGTYILRIEGRGRRHRLRTSVTAIVGPPVPPPPIPHPTTTPSQTGSFTIAGDVLQALAPGGPGVPINLSFHNPGSTTIFVTDVTVSVAGTSAGTGCTGGNFVTTGFSYGTSGISSGSGGVAVPPGQTVSLQAAGVDPQYWPNVRMIDAGDQDACEGASVTLAYADGKAYSP